MKEAQYFSHNYNARNDGKLELLLMSKGLAGIGAYWCILEMLYEENGYLMHSQCVRISFALRVDESFIKEVIFDYELFQFDEEKFWSKSALERISMRNEKTEKARQSAEKRWGKNPDDANALRTKCDGNAINKTKGKEIKEKEIKENTQIQACVFSFKDFFETYPKKTNELLAEDVFHSLTNEEKKEITGKLPDFLEYWETIEVRFVPAPNKFLSEKKWRDAIPPYQKKHKKIQKEPKEITEETSQKKEISSKIWDYYLSLDDDYKSQIETRARARFDNLPIKNIDHLVKNQIIVDIRPEFEKISH